MEARSESSRIREQVTARGSDVARLQEQLAKVKAARDSAKSLASMQKSQLQRAEKEAAALRVELAKANQAPPT